MPELITRLATAVVATTMVSAIALPQIVRAFDGSDGRIIVAQNEDPNKKGPPQKAAPKAPPPPPQKAPPPPPQKQVQPPQPKVQQQQQQQTQPKQLPQQPKVQQQTQPNVQPQQPPKVQQQTQPKFAPKQEPKVQQGQPKTLPSQEPKTVQPQQKFGPKQFERKDVGQPKFGPKQDQQKAVDQPKLAPTQDPKTVQPQQKFGPKQFEKKDVQTGRPGQPGQPGQPAQTGQPGQPGQPTQTGQPGQPGRPGQPGQPTQTGQPGQPGLPGQPAQTGQPGQPGRPGQPGQTAQPGRPTVAPQVAPQTFGQPKIEQKGPRVGNVNELKGKRQEERKGNQVFIREPGNRMIIRDNNNRLVIRHDESERMRRWGNARYEVRGQERFTTVQRGGYDVVTITDNNGRLLRRYRRGPDGREYVLIDNRRRYGVGLGVGAAVVGGAVLLGLAAPVIAMPREHYVVDMGTAPPAYIYEALEAPPVMALERPYTLDEIRDNVELRDRVRSVDINTINFSTGSWEVSPDQVAQLQALADAMLKVIGENSSTVFLLEGHTDAVGPAEDNLSLSDRRAESVAEILTSNFNIPPENLVTQGYGEQNLRVQTDGPSRENRRVQVRNITGLMAEQGQPTGGEPPPGGLPPG